MGIVKVDGHEVIKLTGFKIEDEILLSDSDRMGDHEKVTVLLPKDLLEFLITDNGLLDNLSFDVTVWK